MRIDDEFEAVEKPVVRLYRNGRSVVDPNGRPAIYDSFEDATEAATRMREFERLADSAT